MEFIEWILTGSYFHRFLKIYVLYLFIFAFSLLVYGDDLTKHLHIQWVSLRIFYLFMVGDIPISLLLALIKID